MTRSIPGTEKEKERKKEKEKERKRGLCERSGGAGTSGEEKLFVSLRTRRGGGRKTPTKNKKNKKTKHCSDWRRAAGGEAQKQQ